MTSTCGRYIREGEPFWMSDNAEPWGEVTMHHGWWVHLDQGSPAGSWCWIPGAQPSLARVVWRVADGYVAWVGESSQAGLVDALTRWFGPAGVA